MKNEKQVTKTENEGSPNAKEITEAINKQLESDIEFIAVTDDPKGYLNSKPIVNEVLLRFAYVNEKNELVINGEQIFSIQAFLDLADSLVEARKYSDIIDDWDDDSRVVLGKQHAVMIEKAILDEIEDFPIKFFPISAFLYMDDGIIYETSLEEIPPLYEVQNMAIEDSDVYDEFSDFSINDFSY